MNVQVRYFAALREALGSAETVIVAEGATVGDLRDALIARGVAHATALARSRLVRCAVDQTVAAESFVLHADAEVAFFPPVTGG